MSIFKKHYLLLGKYYYLSKSKWICWNPYNKVVQDHKDGGIDVEKTRFARYIRCLPEWNPKLATKETREPPIY